MDIRKLQRAIVDGLEDVKAQDIVVFNTEHLSPLFERVIVASGTSNRQTKALASSVRESVKGQGMQVLRTEGEDNGEWIIVDCGAAVAHIMQPAIRDYYRLEEIWGGKPVKVKLGSSKVSLVKASEGEDEDDEPARKPVKAAKPKKSSAKAEALAAPAKPGKKRSEDSLAAAPTARPARKTSGGTLAKPEAMLSPSAAAKAAAAKAEAKKTAAKTAAKKAIAKATPVKTLVVKPGAPAKKAAVKKAPIKTTASKAPAKKAAVKVAPVKAAAKKVVAKKAAPAKKAPAKKTAR